MAAAEEICRTLLQSNPADTASLQLLGVIAYRTGRYEEALRLLSQTTASAPDHANLGAVFRALGRYTEAEAQYKQAIALNPHLAAAHYNLGNLLIDQNRMHEATVSFRAALDCERDHAEAWNGLGMALQRQGHLDQAADAFRSAIQCTPGWPEAYTNLGVALLGLEHCAEAEAALRQALTSSPRHAPAHGNLAAVYLRCGRPIAAEIACRAAMSLAPNEHRWLTNLAVALAMQVRHSEAETYYRQALAIQPDYPTGHGNLLFSLNYRTDLPGAAIFAEYQAWDRQHAMPLAPVAQHYALDRTPGRRLRIGYVSPDFRQHAVALFAEPLLAAHDHTCFEIHCYAEVAAPDATTERFRSLASHWHCTVGASDAELADIIRRDRIDILIDLAGHSAGNRLLTFAHKPAPVQVTYLLGHGYTSGLSAMDAFLADDILAPVGSEPLFSERLVRLPRIPLVYQPPDNMPPVAPLPALANRYVTFGYFGRTERLNEAVIGTWARILRAVPQSRLMLNNRPFQEAAFHELFVAQFVAHGIDPARLSLVYIAPQSRSWASYGDIDIALDPFPHNAGTTTIEALWQGVPVVSLLGRPTVGRFGAAILHAIGLDDWVTDTVDSYVARAVAAARDLAALTQLRAVLRPRFAASPLRDAVGLARAIEAIYRDLWQAWCEDDVHQLHRLYQAGDRSGAKGLANSMLERDPGHTEAHHVLGLLAYGENQLSIASDHLRAAIARIPEQAELHANHAAILRSLGRLTDAEAAARTALAHEPENVAAHNNLGNILRDAGRYDESATCYRTAVRLTPRFTDAWVNLAWVLALAGQAKQSEAAAREAIACDPDSANGYNNLGLALMRQGRLTEAEAALRQALALRPSFALPHSNILFCLNYRQDLSAEAIFAEYRRWDLQHAQPLPRIEHQLDLDRASERRLRVGYVSPDFRQHAVALFAEPLLAAHDRAAVELFCYAEVPAPDAVTGRFQVLADHWRSTVGQSDADMAEIIRQDRIDVLVDLAGHTAGNRLLVFARKPAPVQVTYLLGHGYTTGMSVMDAFLADAALVPPGAEALFSEHVVRLPRIPLAYAPPSGMPDVAVLPALASSHVTFGYFGRTVRLNDSVIAAWARILRAVPGSRLMLNNAPFSEPAGRELMTARFAAHGITPAQLALVFTSPQERTWEAYGEIDIALDPFPHNAGTTTIEALWQGVPVVSLAGRPTVGRFGAAILQAVGLQDWVTDDVESYVTRAIAAATDLAALAHLRADLRPRFAASPLRDATGLARDIEAVYRTLWEAWRERTTAAPAELHARGVAHFTRGEIGEAVALLTTSVAARPDAGALSDLGIMLRTQGRLAEAEDAYRRALRIDPGLVAALGNLGNVLLDQSRGIEAESVLVEALKLAPESPWLLRNLALSLMTRGATDRAETALRQALVVAPNDADVHETLGALLSQSGRPVEAEAQHRAALPGLQQRHRGLSNLAIALQLQGRHLDAEDCLREALALQPDYTTAHSNLLFSLNYRADLTADTIFAEYRNWDRQHALKLAAAEQSFALDQTGGQRLRVGYVSPDFRQHAVALFTEPLLTAHDHSQIELFCYADVAVPDACTARFRALADHWHSTVGQSDATVADVIRRDRIDVLVDLAGHTAGSRLLVFARKPAPVQVAYLVGHGYTTGLSAIDAFLADDALAPPGAEALFSEHLVRLPRIPLAYAPPEEMPPVSSLPALDHGFVTFGYFGRPERLNDDVIAAWGDIVLAVPGARLVLNSRSFREAAFCQRVAARFAAHGVTGERLLLLCTEPQPRTWAAYGTIDIALDPFPHNAGTTTIEALWQGIPVVSLAGRPSVGRFGAMILHAIQLDDWVVDDVDRYIARAIEAASDLRSLAQLRGELRPRFAASPLYDAAGLARAVETAYRTLWDAWRASAAAPQAAA